MKRWIAGLALWLAVLLCAPALGDTAYPDGVYRGYYYEGGIEQIAVEFELRGGVFVRLSYRGVKYKDGDYMIDDASDAQKATLRQYDQLAQHLIGRGVESIDDLYMPYDIVEDMDAVTSATMQSSKLISALWDGLGRRPYALVETSVLPDVGTYPDGVYRGSYMDGGRQVALEFTVRGNVFENMEFLTLRCGDTDALNGEGRTQDTQKFYALADYLTGKALSAVNDLYTIENITADTAGAQALPAQQVISAVWDGLNRRPYRLLD